MRSRAASWCLGLGCFLVAFPAAARKTKHDAFLDTAADGTFFNFDFFTLGSQVGVENRTSLEPGMSMLTTRASAMINLPYSQVEGAADLRVFLVGIGGTIGYRHEYRTLIPPPFVPNTREFRREAEADGDYSTRDWLYGEARAQLIVPLESWLLLNTVTWRYEDRPTNSFDWLRAIPHDGGWSLQYDGTLFFRHEELGAIGPAFRFMSLPASTAVGEKFKRYVYAPGITYGGRPGFIENDGDSDLILLQTYFVPFGKQELRDLYGLQVYRAPMYLLVLYRATMSL